jgi:hypothetical protein
LGEGGRGMQMELVMEIERWYEWAVKVQNKSNYLKYLKSKLSGNMMKN